MVIPTIINITFAFIILFYENLNNPKFINWMKQYFHLTAIVTLLCGSDVGGLLLLSSNFAGIKLFSAPFSNQAKKWIYWGSIFNLFIEDLPQLIIQVCHIFY